MKSISKKKAKTRPPYRFVEMARTGLPGEPAGRIVNANNVVVAFVNSPRMGKKITKLLLSDATKPPTST